MPRLLLLTPITPAPSGNGMAMRAWAIMQALKSLAETDVVVLPVSDMPLTGSAQDTFIRPNAVEPAVAAASWLGYPQSRVLAALADGLPERARLAPPARVEQIMKNALAGNYDFVYVFRLYLAGAALPLMNRFPDTRFLLDLDESDHETLEQIADLQEANKAHKQAGQTRLEARRYKEFALQAIPWFDAVACSTELETTAVRRLTGVSAWLIPNTVSTVSSMPERSYSRMKRLLFVGNLSYWPNRDAVIHLLEEIYPVLLSNQMGLKLMIAGRDEQRLRQDYPHYADAAWLGYVPELDAVYQQADACIVPLRAGGGSRIKILEAFERGVPVIASLKAAEGLNVQSGRELFLAETPREIASVVQKLTDEETANRIATAAKSYVRQYHSPDSLRQALDAVIESLSL